MALSQKEKDIKKKNLDEIEVKINEKKSQRNKLAEMQQADLKKVDDEIEELELRRDAYNALK